MNKVTVLLLVMFCISQVSAGPIAYGYIKLEIINRVPEIISISISPDIIYEDSDIQCHVEVDDEEPWSAKIEYEWEITKNEIRCSAIPVDNIKQRGSQKTVVVFVKQAPLDIKLIRNTLNLFGAKINTESTIYLKQSLINIID